ncbi:hypothetical protein [Neptuniibacter sp. QD37_11]|uniref:hypothetical protein n=1 Tax=Neptuniibacter sp. QD37_11 TaxID=3398209 RepID=UPI0039F648D6
MTDYVFSIPTEFILFCTLVTLIVASLRGNHNKVLAAVASISMLYSLSVSYYYGADYLLNVDRPLGWSVFAAMILFLVLGTLWLLLDTYPIFKKWALGLKGFIDRN